MTAEVFRPKFTTSARYHEEKAEERAETGSYFGDRVKRVDAPVTEEPQKPLTRPLSAEKPLVYPPASRPLTDRQKALLHANRKDARERRVLP